MPDREEPVKDTNPKSIFGSQKPQLDKIPGIALLHLAGAMALGASKYGPFNWRKDPISTSTYIGAARRHLLQWWDGAENDDEESLASHLGAVMACCAILIDAEACGTLVDDRPPPAPITEVLKKLTAIRAIEEEEEEEEDDGLPF